MSDSEDPDGFAILMEESDAVAHAPAEDIHHPTDKLERDHDMYPSQMPAPLKKNKKNVKIRHKQTQVHSAKVFLEVFQGWWIKHQLKPFKGNSDFPLWKDMLENDPIGAKEVPHTDVNCWKEVKVGKKKSYVQKDFLKTLKRFQNENYLFYRCSINHYLDGTCESKFKTWIMQQEQAHDPPLTKSNRFDKPVRIVWETMKKEILTYCKPTLGSFHFLTLFTMVRQLNENLAVSLDTQRPQDLH